MVTTAGRIVWMCGAVLLTACAMDSKNPQSSTPPPAESATACDAGKASFARGEVYTEELAQRARQASGAKTVRALRPGQAVTMEFLEHRLNLELDGSGRVTDVRCG